MKSTNHILSDHIALFYDSSLIKEIITIERMAEEFIKKFEKKLIEELEKIFAEKLIEKVSFFSFDMLGDSDLPLNILTVLKKYIENRFNNNHIYFFSDYINKNINSELYNLIDYKQYIKNTNPILALYLLYCNIVIYNKYFYGIVYRLNLFKGIFRYILSKYLI